MERSSFVIAFIISIFPVLVGVLPRMKITHENLDASFLHVDDTHLDA